MLPPTLDSVLPSMAVGIRELGGQSHCILLWPFSAPGAWSPSRDVLEAGGSGWLVLAKALGTHRAHGRVPRDDGWDGGRRGVLAAGRGCAPPASGPVLPSGRPRKLSPLRPLSRAVLWDAVRIEGASRT